METTYCRKNRHQLNRNYVKYFKRNGHIDYIKKLYNYTSSANNLCNNENTITEIFGYLCIRVNIFLVYTIRNKIYSAYLACDIIIYKYYY